MGFTKLLQLEELTLIFYQVDFTDFDFFIEHLVKSCLKLRFVCFSKYHIFIRIYLVNRFVKVVILIFCV